METHHWVMIGVLAALVALSAFFSSSETAYSSFNHIRMKHKANGGDKRAALALRLAEDYDRLLSTILIGNNIVNIASASLSTVLFVSFFADMGATLSTVVMTVVLLIFGEISPKSLAKQNAEKLAMTVAPALRVCIVVFTPLNFLFRQWRKLLDRLFKPKEKGGYTDEELLTLVDEVQNQGAINEQEGELIRNAIEFDDVEAGDILTPRVRLVAVEESDDLQEIAAVFRGNGFSRLPVYRDTIDTIVGVIHEKDLYALLYSGGSDLHSIVKDVVCVAPSIKISALLRLLQQAKSHLAVVVDEFGGTCGIVTMEDIIEELVGDIWDEHDEVEEDIRQVGEGEYLIAGDAGMEEVADMFGLDKSEEAVTVGGWVIERLGSIPRAGKGFDAAGVRITVSKADDRHIQELRFTRLASEQEIGE